MSRLLRRLPHHAKQMQPSIPQGPINAGRRYEGLRATASAFQQPPVIWVRIRLVGTPASQRKYGCSAYLVNCKALRFSHTSVPWRSRQLRQVTGDHFTSNNTVSASTRPWPRGNSSVINYSTQLCTRAFEEAAIRRGCQHYRLINRPQTIHI